jgi:Uma2 family endonuclease
MTGFGLHLPPIEGIDVDDLLALPEGYRYELHEGNLFIMTPSTFWHKVIARRLLLMLLGAGSDALLDPGVLGERPRDTRLPDLGVVNALPPGLASYSNLPGSAYRLVIEVVSTNSMNGEYTDKMDWYAERGIPEYWIVDQAPEPSDGEATVLIFRLPQTDGKPEYVRERTVLLSELEAEYAAR